MAWFDIPCVTFYWSAIVTLTLLCIIFNLFDAECYRERNTCHASRLDDCNYLIRKTISLLKINNCD